MHMSEKTVVEIRWRKCNKGSDPRTVDASLIANEIINERRLNPEGGKEGQRYVRCTEPLMFYS